MEDDLRQRVEEYQATHRIKPTAEYKSEYEALSDAIMQQPNDASLYFERGKLLLDWDYLLSYDDVDYDKELAKADGMADLSHAIELEPHNISYLGERAERYSRQQQYGQAIADYQRILDLEPDNFVYNLALAHLYDFALINYPLAIAYYTNVIEELARRSDGWKIEWNTGSLWPQLRGSLANAYAARAMCYYQSQQYEQGVADYTTLIEHGATPPPEYLRDSLGNKTYYALRAWCYAGLKQHAKAAADYATEEKLSGKSRRQGSVQSPPKEPHEYEQAISTHTAAIEMGGSMNTMGFLVRGNFNDQLATEYRSRAEAHMGLGNYEQATKDYQRAMELSYFHPTFVDMIHAGNATAQGGRYEDAIGYYTLAIEALLDRLEHPERKGEEHQRTLSNMMGKMGKMFAQRFGSNPMAAQISETMVRNIGNLPAQTGRQLTTVRMNYYPLLRSAYFGRAIAYSKMKQHDKALADYSSGIELDPDNAAAYNDRGNAYRGLKQYQQAIADYTHALELNPDYHMALGNRGSTYTKMGRYDEAFADLMRAFELDPNGASKHYHLAYYYSQRHEGGEALPYLKRAIALDPKLRENARDPEDFGWLVEHDPQFAAEFQRLIYGE